MKPYFSVSSYYNTQSIRLLVGKNITTKFLLIFKAAKSPYKTINVLLYINMYIHEVCIHVNIRIYTHK